MKNKNKFFFFFLFIVFSVQFAANAQIAMRLNLRRVKYILYENIYATLQIRNLSANPLVFGQSKGLSGKLDFVITDGSEHKIKMRKINPDFLSGTIIKGGETIEITLSLSEFYKINEESRYTAKAVIEHSQLPNSYQSNTVNFAVVSGRTVWSTVVGTPTVDPMSAKQKIEKRKYEIKSYYDGKNIVYCLVVSDDNYVYGVVQIGIDTGIKKPECIIDNYSRLHILIQDSSNTYTYYVYDTHCNLDDTEIYKKTKTIPTLVLDKKTGSIEVVGGQKFIKGLDR